MLHRMVYIFMLLGVSSWQLSYMSSKYGCDYLTIMLPCIFIVWTSCCTVIFVPHLCFRCEVLIRLRPF
ncbi:hypothetical protein M758_UG289600 [Ceratodon purpureus]|nr:hypothetical protein M758_UG289600 [Ceratodon purpureus]